MTISNNSLRRVAITIDLQALRNNLAAARQACPSAKIFCVLKADAYGHGAINCASALAHLNNENEHRAADGFAVVSPDEALELREAGIRQPLLVLHGPANLADVSSLAKLDLWAVVHDITQCKMLADSKHPGLLGVWVKVDTGMGRLGFTAHDLPRVITALQGLSTVRVLGVLSHLACADNAAGNQHTKTQINAFTSVTRSIADYRGSALLRSLANSSAMLAWPECEFDWVRPGIMLYGANPLRDTTPAVCLRPVMQVRAPVLSVRTMRRGDGIGYDQTYHCAEDMCVGYASIGYGDGFPRVVNNASVLIHGKRVPIIGRVSMDSIALDLRGIDVSVGDQVTLWGPGKPVEEMAAAAGTISYELLCSIRGSRRYTLG